MAQKDLLDPLEMMDLLVIRYVYKQCSPSRREGHRELDVQYI